MTDPEMKKFARSKTLKATALLLIILVVLLLIGETSGDFANGMMFFIEAIASVHTIIVLTILFGLTDLFAGYAGQEIILKKYSFTLN